MTESPIDSDLSERELQILTHLSHGLSNIEIGKELAISPYTVKSHLARISSKIGTGNRAGMVGAAFRTGVLTP